MEIIFNDQSYDGEISEDGFIKEFEKDIKEFDENAKWRNTDIGRGADWPVILTIYSAAISTISTVAQLISFSKEFKIHRSKMEKKYGKLRVSEDCAKLIALDYISENENNINKLKNIYKKTIPIDPPVRNKKTSSLEDNPDSFYFFIYHIDLGNKNEFGEPLDKYYHFIIKSDGKIELSHCLDVPKWYEFQN